MLIFLPDRFCRENDNERWSLRPPFFVYFLIVEVPVIRYPRHPFRECLQQRVSVDNLPGQVELSTALPSQSPVGYVGVDNELQGLMETVVY